MAPVRKNGLGIIDLETKNKELYFKKFIEVFREKESLWQYTVTHKIGRMFQIITFNCI